MMRKIKKLFIVLSLVVFTAIVSIFSSCNISKEKISFVDFDDISISAELGDLFNYSEYLNAVDVDGTTYDVKAFVTDSEGKMVACLKNEFEVLDKNGYQIVIYAVDDNGEKLEDRIIRIQVVKQEGPVVGHIRYFCDDVEVTTLSVLKNYTFLSRIEDITGNVTYTATVYPISEVDGVFTRGVGKAVDVNTNTFYVNNEGYYELEIIATDGVNETKRSSFFTATSAINLISFHYEDKEVTEFLSNKTYTYQSLLNESDGNFSYEVTITPISVVYNSETKTYDKQNLSTISLTSNSFTFDAPREYLFNMQISDGKGKETSCEKILYCVSTQTTDDMNYILIEDFIESSTAACSYGYNEAGAKDKTVMNPTSVWHESVQDKNGYSRYGVISTQSIGDSVNSVLIRSSWMTSAYGKTWWESNKWDYFSFWVYIPSDKANADAVTLTFRGRDIYGRPLPVEIECDVWTEIIWTKQQLGAVMGADANYPQGYPYFCFACDRNNNFNPLFVLEADKNGSTQKKDTVIYLDSFAYMKAPTLNVPESLYVGATTAIEASFNDVEADIDITVKDLDGQTVSPINGKYRFGSVGIYTVFANVEYAGMTFRLNKTIEIVEPIVQVSFLNADNQEITACSVGDMIYVKANVDGVVDGYEFDYNINYDDNMYTSNASFEPNTSGIYTAKVSVVINGLTFVGEATLNAAFDNMTFELAESGVTGMKYPLIASITDKTTGEKVDVTFIYQWSKGDSGWQDIDGKNFIPMLGAGTYTIKASAMYDGINYVKTAEMQVSYQSNVIEDFATNSAKSAMAIMNNGTVDRTSMNTTTKYYTEFEGRYGVVSAKPVSEGATNKSGNDYNLFPISSTIYNTNQLMNIVAGKVTNDRTEYRNLWYTNTDWDYLSIWIYIDDEATNSTLTEWKVMGRYGTVPQIVPMNTWYEFKISKSVLFSNYAADFEQIFTQHYGVIELVRNSNATTAAGEVEKTKDFRVYFDSITLEKYADEEDFTKAYISEYGSTEEVKQLENGVKYQLHFFVGEMEIAYNKITVERKSGTTNVPDWSATDFTFTFAETKNSDDRFYGEFTYTDENGKLYRAFVGAAE